MIASVVAIWVNIIVLDDPSDRARKAADAIAEQVDRLQVAADVVAQAREHGIEVVKPKAAYTAEEWMELLSAAQERLLLVGHALDKWCRDDFEVEFKETLARLAKNGKRVQLVTLPLAGEDTERVHRQRGIDYRTRVEKTLKVVAEVYSSLAPEQRNHLDVRALDTTVDMPYMVVSNEQFLVTSAYPTTAQSSGEMLALKVKTQTDFERALREDVRMLIERYSKPIPVGTP